MASYYDLEKKTTIEISFERNLLTPDDSRQFMR